MDMIKINNTINGITMTMSQDSFWTTYGCNLNGKTRRAAKEIDEALCVDDRERARELLEPYDCIIEFDYVEEDTHRDQ